MKQFVKLFESLDETNSILEKVKALRIFLEDSEVEDQIWGIGLLYGKRPKRVINSRQLQEWTIEVSGYPEWLFQETYQIVGDLAETIARILPEPVEENVYGLSQWMQAIMDLHSKEEDAKKQFVLRSWSQLTGTQRLVFNKLLTGGFRVGVSQKLMVRAIAEFTGREENDIAYRLTGQWAPWTHTLEGLLNESSVSQDSSKPYPFYLAHPLTEEPASLGKIEDWQLEHKWDGIRAQLIIRDGECFLWSRGEELISDKFPEFQDLHTEFPDGTVIDGELLAFREQVLPFQSLQTRIGRKKVGKKLLETSPCVIRAYDLLEWEGLDIRSKPMKERRELLELLFQNFQPTHLQISPVLELKDWNSAIQERSRSREIRSEGLMLKKKDSPYEQGRKKGKWWKWKVDPLHIDAVMIYAMRGHGQRSNLYTDYTFAVWDGDTLVPFTKAYSGLTMEEFKQIDKFVKDHTKEKFGPVRSVDAELVFEIAFEGIQESKRHKSGIALRFPRMSRWRQDKKAEEAGTLAELQQMLKVYGS